MSQLKMKKCSKCKKERDISLFIGRRKKETKQCDHCRQIDRKCAKKNKCIHNKIKYKCIECGGISTCIHKNTKYECRECKGKGICEHNRRKRDCKDCKGSSICEHNNKKRRCKECNGNDLCKHYKYKYRCKECDPNGHLLSCVRIKSKKNKKKFRIYWMHN